MKNMFLWKKIICPEIPKIVQKNLIKGLDWTKKNKKNFFDENFSEKNLNCPKLSGKNVICTFKFKNGRNFTCQIKNPFIQKLNIINKNNFCVKKIICPENLAYNKIFY